MILRIYGKCTNTYVNLWKLFSPKLIRIFGSFNNTVYSPLLDFFSHEIKHQLLEVLSQIYIYIYIGSKKMSVM